MAHSVKTLIIISGIATLMVFIVTALLIGAYVNWFTVDSARELGLMFTSSLFLGLASGVAVQDIGDAIVNKSDNG